MESNRRRVRREGTRRGFVDLTVPLVLALLLGSAPAGGAEEAPHVSASVAGGKVSLTARGAPLADVLAELSRVSGLALDLDASAEAELAAEPTTIVFETVTPEEALRRLLRDRNFALVTSPDGIERVRVYGRGAPAAHRTPTARRTQALAPPEVPSAPRRAETMAEGVRLRAEALGHRDPTQRALALERLAESPDRKALATVLQVLDRERDLGVLQSALNFLLGQDSVPLRPILRFVTAHREPALRLRGLEVIGRFGRGNPQATELLRSLARSDRHEEVREAARRLLAEVEPHADAAPLGSRPGRGTR